MSVFSFAKRVCVVYEALCASLELKHKELNFIIIHSMIKQPF